MAKKGTKKVENKEIPVVQEPVTETTTETVEVVTVEDNNEQVVDIEKEATEAINTLVGGYVGEVNAEIDNMLESVKQFTNEIEDETVKKENFLTQFEANLETQTEEELRDVLKNEIDRIDNLISKISENKIPMTTTYWNGMNFDF